ncbi:hypothetical protein NBRC116592_07600 [Colwellia sp. KU-HH00111]|uniref:cyclic nucleotide-binding domain-containing protein n=1 Tax=Colwellia sp. KU-HH00111 TaxID=3127652 RepID=UPI0031084E49
MTDLTKLKLMEIANRVPLFKALNAHEKGQVIAIDNIVKVIKKDTAFINYGDRNDNFFILLSGSASVYQHDHKIAKVKGGQFVGEVGFICGDPRTATVVADTDLVTFCIDRSRFMYLPATLREKIKDRLINGLVDRVESMNEHIAQLDKIVSHYQTSNTEVEQSSQAPQTAQANKSPAEKNKINKNQTAPNEQAPESEQCESTVITAPTELSKTLKKRRKPTWK